MTIGDAAHTGIVGRVFLALNSSSIPGVQLDGVFLLELNTFASVKSVDTFKIKRRTLASGREVFDGFEHDAAGHLLVASEQLDVVGGFKLVMSGELIVANTLHISAEVQFRIELAGADPGIELLVNGTMNLAPIGGINLVDSGFRINRDGLVARVQLALDVDFGAAIGLKFSVSGLLSLNTTGRVQTLGSSSVDPGFRLRIEGEVEFLGFAKGSGFVDITISQEGFQLLFGVVVQPRRPDLPRRRRCSGRVGRVRAEAEHPCGRRRARVLDRRERHAPDQHDATRPASASRRRRSCSTCAARSSCSRS